MHACCCCDIFSSFSTKPSSCLERTSPRWSVLCRVGCKTLTQSQPMIVRVVEMWHWRGRAGVNGLMYWNQFVDKWKMSPVGPSIPGIIAWSLHSSFDVDAWVTCLWEPAPVSPKDSFLWTQSTADQLRKRSATLTILNVTFSSAGIVDPTQRGELRCNAVRRQVR